MSPVEAHRREIERASGEAQRQLQDYLVGGGNLAVVQAPPGSGKTRVLVETAAAVASRRARIAIATPTNSQADEVCRRFARDHAGIRCMRFASGESRPPVGFPASIPWVTSEANLNPAQVAVGTAAKWGAINLVQSFDLLFVDEAWQLSWADLMLLAQVSARFVLIGDPGQIPPVVTIDVSRWETAPRPPHLPAPEVIVRDRTLNPFRVPLPATWRLPHDSAQLLQPFYRFPFGSFAGPGERSLRATRNGRDGIDKVVDLLGSGTVAGYTLPTPDGGAPLERDDEIAQAAVEVAARLLRRDAVVQMDGRPTPLQPTDIGLCSTHRVMNTAMMLRLHGSLRRDIRVDTPERWQGLERKVMVVVHPLSGVERPSDFDLETGRLCVMASRHQAGLVLVGRDHLSETLRDLLPVADQAVGRPDVNGIGHSRNLGFWDSLERSSRVIAA